MSLSFWSSWTSTQPTRIPSLSVPADGSRGSNVNEVNQWLWQFGRGRPRIGSLPVFDTEERSNVVLKTWAKRSHWLLDQQPQRGEMNLMAWVPLKGYPRITQSRIIILTYPGLYKSGNLIPTYPGICMSHPNRAGTQLIPGWVTSRVGRVAESPE